MKHILVVDNDKTNLSAARSVLNGTYKVTPVLSGMQALKFLENNDCDLILLDINMPEINGFELLEKIKANEEKKDIPVIFLTADVDSQTESRCLEEGAVDYIAKPFVPVVMLSRISRTLELAEMRKQLAVKLEQKIKEVSDIKSRSKQDALTGLWNRKYTEEKVNELSEAGGCGALFMIDMDNFKAINDNYGHIEGDNTLKMFADTMRDFASEGDILCRIGGDEFIMFVNGVTEKEKIEKLAGDIISDLCAKIEAKNFETNTSVSIGISQIPNDGTEFDAVYNAADKALYYVKQNGKNSYHFYSDKKAAERSRASTLIDLKYLKEIMARADAGKGPYQLNIESFNHIYHFISRFLERNDSEVRTLLFTVHTKADSAETEQVLEALEYAISTSLRRTDISTRYSGKQIITVLIGTNSENGNLVAERIIQCFERLYMGSDVKITYDIAKLEGNFSAAKNNSGF